ncbi:MAG TPA: hypothetical protein VFS25_03890, partial [Chitinophaga sp.]|uniref:hypothetical protein n=1 Tax=Chitinophaga sp. TaxID=1869181 RepID=UPI002DB761FB
MSITFNSYSTIVQTTVIVEEKCGNFASTNVTIVPPLADNITISPASQTINCGTTGATLTASTPSGGDNTYTYQWQSSSNGSTWNNISGATGNTYTPSGLSATTYFRVAVTSFDYTVTSSTATVVITTPTITAGTISNTAQAINYNTTPASIVCSVAAGGCSYLPYTYQWQSSSNGTTWNNINGATSQNYQPGSLTATTHYRRAATNNGVTVYSTNTATVTVYPQLTTSISPTAKSINYNTSPGAITAARSGGNGAYTYQWQSSPNNSTWSNINGATAQTYTPGNLVASVYYRVITTSNGVSVTSNVSTVTVYPQLTTSISPTAKSINYNTSPGAITAARSGGNGAYTYQWQSS